MTPICSPAGDLHQPDGHWAWEAVSRGVQGQGGGCGGKAGSPLSGTAARETEGDMEGQRARRRWDRDLGGEGPRENRTKGNRKPKRRGTGTQREREDSNADKGTRKGGCLNPREVWNRDLESPGGAGEVPEKMEHRSEVGTESWGGRIPERMEQREGTGVGGYNTVTRVGVESQRGGDRDPERGQVLSVVTRTETHLKGRVWGHWEFSFGW